MNAQFGTKSPNLMPVNIPTWTYIGLHFEYTSLYISELLIQLSVFTMNDMHKYTSVFLVSLSSHSNAYILTWL